MATMNISLPGQMRTWVQARIESGEYANASDYVRDLIRRDKIRLEQRRIFLDDLHEGQAAADRGEIMDLDAAFDAAQHLIKSDADGNL